MTTYSIKEENKKIFVEVKGHTNYNDKGYDILCASISTMTIFTINSLDNLGYNIEDLKNEDGFISFKVLSDKTSKGIIKTLKELLDDLSKKNPEFINEK